MQDKAHSYAPERIARGQASLPGRPKSPRLGSEDENSAQRLYGPEVPPLCHASRSAGDQRGHSDAQPLMCPVSMSFSSEKKGP